MLTYSRISYLIPPYLRFPPCIQETKLSQWNMKLDIGFYFPLFILRETSAVHENI